MLYLRLFAFCFLAASATGLKPALAPSTIKTRSPAIAMQYGQQQGYGQQQQGGYGQQQGMQGGYGGQQGGYGGQQGGYGQQGGQYGQQQGGRW